MRRDEKPRLFRNYNALRKYTIGDKIFPKDLAKKDGFIRVFLKKLF